MEAVLYETKDNVAIITLNRPESLNSMSLDLVDGVITRLNKAKADSTVRVIVLTGAGRAFSAGGDLKSLDSLHTTEERRQFIAKVGKMVKAIQSVEKPVVAMVNGVAAGAGFNLAISCDLVYAAQGVKFIQSFVNVGLSPDCGGFYYLPKAIGMARAKELMFTARPLFAEEAKELGLVNDIFLPDELKERVMEKTRELAKAAPLAIAMTKQALNSYSASLDDTLVFEAFASSALLGTEDFAEGVAAFKEKRKPEFNGR